MEKMIGWMPRVWLKNKIDNAKLQKKLSTSICSALGNAEFHVDNCHVDDERTAFFKKHEIKCESPARCDLHIFIEFPS